MDLMLAIAAGAGLVTGLATARVFGGRRETPAMFAAPEPNEALAELRTLRALCDIPNVNSIRRYSLATEAGEAMQRCLESLVGEDVRAAAITAEGGAVWKGLGDLDSLRDASSFAARLDHVPPKVLRVAWRSDQGIEIVAQRFPMLRQSRWVVCVASGTPVDRMRLARVAYESGLRNGIELAQDVEARPLTPADLGGWRPLVSLCEHSPLRAARVWTRGEKRFSVGAADESRPVLRTQVALHAWSQLVAAKLGAELGTLYETGSTRIAFHPVAADSLLELVTGTTRPHPWRRAYAAARQLEHSQSQREAS